MLKYFNISLNKLFIAIALLKNMYYRINTQILYQFYAELLKKQKIDDFRFMNITFLFALLLHNAIIIYNSSILRNKIV